MQIISGCLFVLPLVPTRHPNPQLRQQPSLKEVPGASPLQSHPGPQQWGEIETQTHKHMLTEALVRSAVVSCDSHAVVSAGNEGGAQNCVCGALHAHRNPSKGTRGEVWWTGTAPRHATCEIANSVLNIEHTQSVVTDGNICCPALKKLGSLLSVLPLSNTPSGLNLTKDCPVPKSIDSYSFSLYYVNNTVEPLSYALTQANTRLHPSTQFGCTVSLKLQWVYVCIREGAKCAPTLHVCLFFTSDTED